MLFTRKRGAMKLDVFERFSNGKWLGVYQTDRKQPPEPGDEINLGSLGMARVRSCEETPARHTDEPWYTVIVERL